MEKNSSVLFGIIGIAVVLILAIIITGIPVLNNTPPATACTPGGSDSIAFLSDVNGTEDSLTFRYIPKDELPGTYQVSYEIYENGAVIRTEQDKEYTGISPENPFMILISRQRNATYTMNMSILKDGASCPYQSRVSIATGIAK